MGVITKVLICLAKEFGIIYTNGTLLKSFMWESDVKICFLMGN